MFMIYIWIARYSCWRMINEANAAELSNMRICATQLGRCLAWERI